MDLFIGIKFNDLHSTIFILPRGNSRQETGDVTEFTFYYIYITTDKLLKERNK